MTEVYDAIRLMIREEVKKAIAETRQESQTVWLSQQEAAAYCGVNVATIRKWHGEGLNPNRVGKVCRYKRDELDAFLSKDKPQASISLRVKEILTRKAG